MRILYLTLLLTATLTVSAQEEIETDRPSETENTSTVLVNHFQVEAGFAHLQEANDIRTFTIPSVLLKYGLAKNVELRIITEIEYKKEESETAKGLQPVTVGFKYKLWNGRGAMPETSLLAQAEIPTLASSDLKQQHLAPEVRLLFKNKLSGKTDLSYNVGAEWDGSTQEVTYVYTFSPSFKINDKFLIYIEEYAFLPQHEHANHWIDGGLQFLLTKSIQLDFAAGYGLSAHNHYHSYFETVGISFRI